MKFETLLQRHPKIKQIFDHNTGYTPGKKSNTKSSLFVVEMFFLDKSREMKKFDKIGKFMIIQEFLLLSRLDINVKKQTIIKN